MTEISIPKPGSWTSRFRRGPWENAAMTTIGIGVLMMTQPFFLDLYSYSFVTILGGSVGFVIVSHFPQ
jgi:hypothetical protein